MNRNAIRWVMFDWGNVLVDYRPLGFPKLAARLGAPLDVLVGSMAESGIPDALGTGAMAPKDFCAWLRDRFAVTLSANEIAELFAEDVSSRLPGIEVLIARLRRHYRLAMLSNTFFAHWDQVARDPFYRAFEMPLASHLLGAQKPDSRIFTGALARLDAAPSEVVFVDDGLRHVEAARALGLHVVHGSSVAATIAGLEAILLPTPQTAT